MWVVVSVDGSLSLFGFNLAINSFIFVIADFEELFDKLKHVSELREDEYFFALPFTLFEKFLNKNHFSTCSNEFFDFLLLSWDIFQ